MLNNDGSAYLALVFS